MFFDAVASLKTRSPLAVFGVFAAGIVIPGVFLSYLGTRSLYYESMLLKKQSEDQFAAVANLMQKKAGDRLLSLIGPVSDLARHESIQRLSAPDMTRFVLSSKKVNELPLEALYIFDDQDRVRAPWYDDSTINPARDIGRDLDWGSLKPEIERLEELEFVQRDTASALKGYLALQSRALSRSLQASLLKTIAGGYRKLQQNRQAESAYVKLVHDYGDVLDVSGLPMGVLANQLLIKLYDDESQLEKSLGVQLDLFEGMVFGQWTLSAKERHRLIQSTEKTMTETFASHPAELGFQRSRWERLRGTRVELEQIQSETRVFETTLWPGILERLRVHGWQESGGVLQLQNNTPAHQVCVVAPLYLHDNVHRKGWIVALFPEDALWPLVDQSLSELAQPVGLQVDWEHSSDHKTTSLHRPVKSFWQADLERSITAIDPPIIFSLHDDTQDTKDHLARRRRWIYSGMIGLSFIVIFVGLWAMRQAIKRETEVANLKADFVANVSHELRTPLATISHIGERLSLGRVRSEDERNEFYGMLGEETKRLRTMVEEILNFSKVLAGKKVYRQDPVDLLDVIKEAYARIKGKAEAQGFEIQVHDSTSPVEVLGDQHALVQGVTNLLDNAVKYSGESRKIVLGLTVGNAEATLFVKDFGIGIPESEKTKIFEKFYRVEHALSQVGPGGVGLGLAMAKHIIEGHKGRIQVETTLGKGSCFSLIFPLTTLVNP